MFKNNIRLAVVFTTLITSSIAWGQGTSVPMFSIHAAQPNGQILIGTATSPIPVALGPAPNSWLKSIGDPLNAIPPGLQVVDLIETVVNVGTQPWTDWHEIILPPPVGLVPATWSSVVGLKVNNTSIGFSAWGLGMQTLDLYAFSQPVLPGDVLEIHKQALVVTSSTGGEILRIQQYPTSTVPEPSSLLLASILLATAAMKRRS